MVSRVDAGGAQGRLQRLLTRPRPVLPRKTSTGTTPATGTNLETDLYRPIKRHLESLGLTVKGEIGGCDLVALSGDDPPIVVIGELKLSFNLELVLQGVDRAAAGDEVWLAARLSARGKGRESDARFRNLCRRLGFGMLGVTARARSKCCVSPVAPAPRRDPKRRSRLVEEHRRRKGDPVAGGGSRAPVMTAYRQRALACAARCERARDARATSARFPTRRKSCGQRLRLVRAGRTRHLRPDRARRPGAGHLGGPCRLRGSAGRGRRMSAIPIRPLRAARPVAAPAAARRCCRGPERR